MLKKPISANENIYDISYVKSDKITKCNKLYNKSNYIEICSLHKPEKLYENNTKGKFLYIRHGETEYNVKTKHIEKDIAGVDPNHLDLSLNETGVNQSLQLADKLNEFKIQVVFTSPLKRCLETAFHSLKDHPEKDKFKILICPFLNETVHSTHDFSINIIEKKQYFSKKNLGLDYDWSFFEETFPKIGDQELYYLNFIDTYDENDERINIILEKLKKTITDLNSLSENNNFNFDNFELNNYQEFKEKYQKELLNRIRIELSDFAFYYLRIYKKKPESLTHMFNRNLRCKELFSRISEKLNKIKNEKDFSDLKFEIDKDEKVLVYTHSAFIKIATSNLAYEMKEIDKYPVDSFVINNCEIISMNI